MRSLCHLHAVLAVHTPKQADLCTCLTLLIQHEFDASSPHNSGRFHSRRSPHAGDGGYRLQRALGGSGDAGGKSHGSCCALDVLSGGSADSVTNRSGCT